MRGLGVPILLVAVTYDAKTKGHACHIEEVFPDQIRDARNAVRFMRVHASEYGIDPARVAIMGDSSGGHTATYAGILHDDGSEHDLFPGTSAEISCIVNYYGLTDLTFADSNPTTVDHNKPTSPEGRIMGGIDLNVDREAHERLSVRCNVDESSITPPIPTLHGTKDRIVNTRCSVLLHERLVETGHDSTLYLLRGADHGGPKFWTPEVLSIVDAFIINHM